MPESRSTQVRIDALRRLGAWGAIIAAGSLLVPGLVRAQDALRSSLATSAAMDQRGALPENLPYTLKAGDFRLLLVPSLTLDWNDNIAIERTSAAQDFILRPMLNVSGSYPLTANNLLSANVGVGYDKYLQHDEYSRWHLQSGSQLAFDMHVKDLWINLHDRADYTQDSAQEAQIAGTAAYATINNTVGLLATLDLNDVTLSAGYDHQNEISESQEFQQLTHSTDMVLGRAGLKLNPQIVAGTEATAAYTTYEQMVLNNNDAYSVGGYADFRPAAALRIQPRGGYTVIQFQHSSPFIQTSAINSWYADLNINHQITDTVSYSLDAGHEVRLGIQSDATDDWYVRPAVHLSVIKDLGINTSLSYEHGKMGQGNILGNLVENYDWLTASLGLTYPLMKKLAASINYRLTLRSSNISSRDYTQNLVSLQLSYRPQ